MLSRAEMTLEGVRGSKAKRGTRKDQQSSPGGSLEEALGRERKEAAGEL